MTPIFSRAAWRFAAMSLVWAVSVWATTQTPRAAQAGGMPTIPVAPAFDTSDNCSACHNGLATPAGEDASIATAWRASMMANAARDPYWQAGVRRETIDHPTKREAIEDECAICHMPMARTLARAAGRHGEVFRLAGPGSSEEHRLASDGVSCMLCHQIGPERLGTPESFVGGFVLARPDGTGPPMFGPYEVERGLTTIMRSATGARPAAAEHLRESEVCATCHTLYTEAFNAQGEVIGSLPEQVPYLEWQHSAFATERSCQSCHMPVVEQTPIASVLGPPRERLARHTFVGGNFLMQRMLNAHRQDLGVVAPASELDAAARATLRQLESDTATVSIARADVRDGRLEADVLVRNLTGHKLPTGYPSRRVWIHMTVRDARGDAVFESGAVAGSGAIQGNDNDTEAARYEPHYQEIRSADQVQIYETVMADADGRVTTGLLAATSFVKDNRLLPRGFDASTAHADIAVKGAAGQDADFNGDGDRIRYVVDVSRATGPYEIDVELRYQSIAFRWADNLRSYDAPEPQRFVSFYQGMAAASSTVLGRDRRILRAKSVCRPRTMGPVLPSVILARPVLIQLRAIRSSR
jgi:hypothetical protein